MAGSFSSIEKPVGGQEAVRRPRPADAIGRALGGVFDGQASIPDDMMKTLGALDRIRR